MNNVALTIIRYGLTVIMAGLTAAYTYYPHDFWIPIALATLAPIGIHVIPSQAQSLLPKSGG